MNIITNEFDSVTAAFEKGQFGLRAVESDQLTLALSKTYCSAFGGGEWRERHDPDETLLKWSAQASNEEHTYVECMFNGIVVGGGAYAPLTEFEDKFKLLPEECANSIYINELWVDPKYQGRQIGRFILVNMEQMIISSGRKQISLWTHFASERLIKFYSVNGYRELVDVHPSDGGVKRKVFFKDFEKPHLTGDHCHD